MSDTVLSVIVVCLLVAFLAWLFRKPISHRFFGSGSISGDLQFPGIKGRVAFGETEKVLNPTEKKALEQSVHDWNRDASGHLYWYAADLTVAIPVSMQSDADVVKHYIRQCFWHASQLSLGEPIEGRFRRLCEKTASYTVNDWNTVERRREIHNELGAMLHAAAFIIEGENFQGKPPDDWFIC